MSTLLDIGSMIFSLIGSLLYPMFGIIFVIIDTIQNIFYGFAGLGSVRVGSSTTWGGGQVTNDGLAQGNFDDNRNGIVYYLLRSDTAWNILLSMVILGLFLLIIFTVMAFLKNMYAAKQKKWQEIISSSIKGLINFLFLPVCCLIGVVAGNVLLKALNDATANSSNVSFSRMLFVSSAYQANTFRSGGGEKSYIRLYELYRDSEGFSESTVASVAGSGGKEVTVNGVSYGRYDPSQDGTYAELLDNVYRSSNSTAWIWPYPNGDSYNLWEINYLLLGAGGVFILFALIKICFGAVKRLFMLTVLFVISPAVCSLYPLDDGSAANKWRSEFLKWFFSVYGAVIGLNLFFLLVPLINSLNFGWWDAIGIVPLLITIAGLYMTTDFINLITSFIPNAGNVLSEGSSLAGQVKGGFKKTAKAAGTAGVAVAGAFTMAHAAKKQKNDFLTAQIDEKTDKHYQKDLDAARSAKANASLKDRLNRNSQVNKDLRQANEAARKARENFKNAHGNDYKQMESEAGTGWWGSMGGSMLGGIKNLVDTTSSNLGFGKVSTMTESVRKKGAEGKERTEKQQKTNRTARKAAELLSSLEPELPDSITSLPEGPDRDKATKQHNLDQMEKINKTIGGENGEDIWGVLKKNDVFKAAYAASGYGGDLSKMTAEDFMTRHKGQTRQFEAMNAQVAAYKADKEFEEGVRKAVEKIISDAGSTLDLNKIFESILSGKFEPKADMSTEDFVAALRIREYMGNNSIVQKNEELRANVQSTTIQAQNVTEANRENGDSEFTATMDRYLGYLQQTLNSLKNNTAIREMDVHLTEQFKQLIQKQTEMIKKLKETSTAEKDAIVDAVKKAAQKASDGKK